VHVARVRVEAGGERPVLLCVTQQDGGIQVRIEAPDTDTRLWLEERVGRIREAVASAGVRLDRLELSPGRPPAGRDPRRRRPQGRVL
jgi:hypothetical protein